MRSRRAEMATRGQRMSETVTEKEYCRALD